MNDKEKLEKSTHIYYENLKSWHQEGDPMVE